MKPLLLSLFSSELLTDELCKQLDVEVGTCELREFPDGETYLKIDESINKRDIIIFESLYKPNKKIVAIIFAVETLRELGANKIGLVAPYLSYMRQDKRFKPGEAITSNYFARLISNYFDWMVTIDPHLHRHHTLDEIYSIPSKVVHAAPVISKWIMQKIDKPIIIGPDIESEQWVSKVAKEADAPFLVLEKIRKGDRDVEVSNPDVEKYRDHTPVLVDDIISTARTMIETVKHIKDAKMKPPICIGVHAIFSGSAYDDLKAAGTDKIVSCNTILHPTNEIDISNVIVEAINDIEELEQ